MNKQWQCVCVGVIFYVGKSIVDNYSFLKFFITKLFWISGIYDSVIIINVKIVAITYWEKWQTTQLNNQCLFWCITHILKLLDDKQKNMQCIKFLSAVIT